ncbi:Zinc finger protein 14 [Paragonimus heterotremus]|uniref:Zinc finger protein 14 n=1 Tax=Paragonimus heterotremus TaxID=100268 RepID=A0A8J4STH2_9TREM|nr:Zinc finger protein 14 [Paragonimus heterotremus]
MLSLSLPTPVMVQNTAFAPWNHLSTAPTVDNTSTTTTTVSTHPTSPMFQFPQQQQHQQQQAQQPQRGALLGHSVNSVSMPSPAISVGPQSSVPLTVNQSTSQQLQQQHLHQLQLQQHQHQQQLQLQQHHQLQLQQQQLFRQQQQSAQLAISSGLQQDPQNSTIGFTIPTTLPSRLTDLPLVQQQTTQPQIHEVNAKAVFTPKQQQPGIVKTEKNKRKSKPKASICTTPSTISVTTSSVASTLLSVPCSQPMPLTTAGNCRSSSATIGELSFNGGLSSAVSLLNSINCNSVSERSTTPLPTVLSPLPTLPEEILLKIDPSLGDPPPPPHADISVVKPYQCDQCFKRYSGMKSLKNHKLTHSDIKPHKCSVCGKAFLRADKMRMHEISHLNVKPFECATCKQRFTRSDKLKIHHRTHTGVRPYACTFCPKRFTRSDKLKIHERIHTKIKPYECAHCGKCFARSDKRRLHERTHLYGPRPRTGGGSRKGKSAAAVAVSNASSTALLGAVNSMDKAFGLNNSALSMSTAPNTSTLTASSTVLSSATAFGLASIAGSAAAAAAAAAATFVSPLGFPAHQMINASAFDGSKRIAEQVNGTPTTTTSLTPSFPFSIPSSQQLQFPSQHHSTLASLAGIAQYHPALFAAQQPRQLTPPSTLTMPVPLYQQPTLNQSAYQSASMMPFFVGTTNANGATLTPFIGNTAMSTVNQPQCPVSSAAVYEATPACASQSYSSATSPSLSRSNVAMNNVGAGSGTGNIAAVMAAAALGRQFHQTQQQQQQQRSYQMACHTSLTSQVPVASAFVQSRPQQQQTQQAFAHQSIKSELQQQPIKQEQQLASIRPGFQFYQAQQPQQQQTQLAHTTTHHQMLQHQQQVMQLHHQLQQQQLQQQQQLMQHHTAMLQHHHQNLITPAHSAAAAAISLFPSAAAQFIPGVVPSQYAHHSVTAQPQQQQYMQVQQQQQQHQQQQYLAAAAALSLQSAGTEVQLQHSANNSSSSIVLPPKVG